MEARQDLKDAWLTGKIETLYTFTRPLNPFDIDTQVEDGVVHLTGSVESEVERDLAGELAKSVEGVTEVRNDLKVASAASLSSARRAEREQLARQRTDMRRWVEDASTSAVVKSKLLANQNTKGFEIKVETRNRVVTLSGQVSSAEERQLAELLARNTDNVAEVRNELTVDTARAARSGD
ncbi:MAG TPA: BON domain-containing protein [Steroidobacteraceae bacterium]|nr:BON domain-containing protein [Steroidobacteraceae bacterium]